MSTNGTSTAALALAVPDALVDAIARRVVDLMPAPQAQEADPWLDLDAAARHLGYGDGDEAKLERGRRRVYDLKARREIEWAKDGARLVFRRSWLDAYLERSK